MFHAILWDMDGTIVDTERVVWEVMRDAFQSAARIDLPQTLFESLLGQSELDFYRAMRARYDLSDDVLAAIHLAFEDTYIPRLKHVPALPGAVEKVIEFHARAPQAVVTGSTTAQASAVLGALGLNEHFRALITCDVYGRGKPHPEPYLTAAEQLGVEPTSCLVLEDSPAGVTAAKEAGMKVVGIHEGNQGKYDIRHADWEIPSLSELNWEELLRRLA